MSSGDLMALGRRWSSWACPGGHPGRGRCTGCEVLPAGTQGGGRGYVGGSWSAAAGTPGGGVGTAGRRGHHQTPSPCSCPGE